MPKRFRRAPAPFPKKPREHQFEFWLGGYRRGYVPWPTDEQITLDVAKDLYARFEAACARHHLTNDGVTDAAKKPSADRISMMSNDKLTPMAAQQIRKCRTWIWRVDMDNVSLGPSNCERKAKANRH